MRTEEETGAASFEIVILTISTRSLTVPSLRVADQITGFRCSQESHSFWYRKPTGYEARSFEKNLQNNRRRNDRSVKLSREHTRNEEILISRRDRDPTRLVHRSRTETLADRALRSGLFIWPRGTVLFLLRATGRPLWGIISFPRCSPTW